MYRMISLAAVLACASLQGCATSHPRVSAAPDEARNQAHPAFAVIKSALPESSAAAVAHFTEVPIEANAPDVQGHPLTSVVVTQCNLIVAVYMTMPDGRLLRFDHDAALPPDQLMSMAYSATRSERVEVSCNDSGVAGYEKHDPV